MTSTGSGAAPGVSPSPASSTGRSRAPLEESTIRPTGVRTPLVRRSTRSASVPVGTRADVTGRVQRLAAERAGGAPGGGDRPAPSGEVPGSRGVEHDAQRLNGLLFGLLGVLVV